MCDGLLQAMIDRACMVFRIPYILNTIPTLLHAHPHHPLFSTIFGNIHFTYIYIQYIYKCLFSSHSSIKHPRRQGIFFSAKRRICSRARRRILGRTVTRIGSCIPCDKWRYIIWISLDALWEWWFAIIPTLIFGWWTRIYPDECS